MPLESLIIDLLAAVICIYAWTVLPAGKIRWFFIASFLLMSIYKIYDPASDSRSLLWARHLPVYCGEALFYFFVATFCKRYIEIEDRADKSRTTVIQQNVLVIAPLLIIGSGVSWFQIVTDQGLPHIFTLPLFVLVVSLVRLKLTVYKNRYIPIISLLTYATGAWIMVHISEFIVESQQLLPGLDKYMPHIEFFWYCVGILVYGLALYRFKITQHDTAT